MIVKQPSKQQTQLKQWLHRVLGFLQQMKEETFLKSNIKSPLFLYSLYFPVMLYLPIQTDLWTFKGKGKTRKNPCIGGENSVPAACLQDAVWWHSLWWKEAEEFYCPGLGTFSCSLWPNWGKQLFLTASFFPFYLNWDRILFLALTRMVKDLM